MASVRLKISYPLFRTWSSKRIIPSWTGKWEVVVKDENENIIATKSFLVLVKKHSLIKKSTKEDKKSY